MLRSLRFVDRFVILFKFFYLLYSHVRGQPSVLFRVEVHINFTFEGNVVHHACNQHIIVTVLVGPPKRLALVIWPYCTAAACMLA